MLLPQTVGATQVALKVVTRVTRHERGLDGQRPAHMPRIYNSLRRIITNLCSSKIRALSSNPPPYSPQLSSSLPSSLPQSVCLSVRGVLFRNPAAASRVGSSLHLSSPAPSVDYSSFSPSPFHFPRGDTFVKLLGRKEGVYKLGASNRGGFFSKV